jgi:hypothetical protein
MGLILKGNPLASEIGIRGFSKWREGFFFLMKTVEDLYYRDFFKKILCHRKL